jgi:hypothetical protein
MREKRMRGLTFVWVILVAWVLASPTASHGEECLINDLESQKQRFKSQYAGAIPKDINDLVHKVSQSEAFSTFKNTFTRVVPYLPITTRALVRVNPQDATRSIAGLDPGHPGLNVSQSALARNIQPSFSPTTIFSDDFQTRSLSSWGTSGPTVGISSMEKFPPFNYYAYMTPSGETLASSVSMSHNFTLPQLTHVTTSFDYMVRSFADVTTGNFGASLDSSGLLNINISDINLANYESFPTIRGARLHPLPEVWYESRERSYFTSTWSHFESSCTTLTPGAHKIEFETVRNSTRTVSVSIADGMASTTPGGPIVYVDNVEIKTCELERALRDLLER